MKGIQMENSINNNLSLTSIIAAGINGIAAAVDFIFCIPVLGRILKWVWNSILTIITLILGLLEHMLKYRPIKKLRIGVLILTDEQGEPLTTPEIVYTQIKRAQDIYKQAKIEIIPAFPPLKKLPEEETLPESAQWIRTLSTPTPKSILDVDCDFKAIIQDLTLPGFQYQYNTIKTFFHSSFRRVFGFGAPITVFIVRKITKKGGCSIGWLSDYVTLRYKHSHCLAHEVGHACNLLHTDDPENLMYPKSCDPEKITPRQIILMRSSRHVSYF
jgi:hypothetical protein